MKQTLHFPGLNGLRAIAALAVLFLHTTHALNEFGLDSFVFGKNPDGDPKATLLAGFGISIFFALSGFLITYLLLEEKKMGEINIRNFYIRRMLRIWPLYYSYFLLCLLTVAIFDIPFNEQLIFFYVFLLANIPFILGVPLPLIGHYWSLGVEEQFYAFWPWLVKKSNSILKVTIAVCISLFLLKCLFRYIDLQMNQGQMAWPYVAVHVTRFHCMLIGAIGAILHSQNNAPFLKLTNNLITQGISWLIIFLTAINEFHILSFLDNEFISIITVFIIIGQIQKTNRIVNLDVSFFDFIGKISYGIYVIHPLILFYLSKAIVLSDKTNTLNYVMIYLIVFSTTIFIAYLSYHFFEKRFLRLKDKYSSIRSSANSEGQEENHIRSNSPGVTNYP